jgi:hypothetical protein
MAIILHRMYDDPEGRPSTELEELRLMLFPHLSREEGRRRIEAAFDRAADSDRAERIERLASNPDLDEELMRTLLRFGRNGLT